MPPKDHFNSDSARLAVTGTGTHSQTGRPRFLIGFTRTGGRVDAIDLSVRDATRLLGALDQFLRDQNKGNE